MNIQIFYRFFYLLNEGDNCVSLSSNARVANNITVAYYYYCSTNISPNSNATVSAGDYLVTAYKISSTSGNVSANISSTTYVYLFFALLFALVHRHFSFFGYQEAANGMELSRCDRGGEAAEGAVGWSELLGGLYLLAPSRSFTCPNHSKDGRPYGRNFSNRPSSSL